MCVHSETILGLSRHGLLLVTVIACAYTDTARGRIYNVATIPALLLGLGISILLDSFTPGNKQILGSALALLAGGGIFGLAYLMRGMGAGDVKMMAAIGAISADWRFALLAAFYSALVGAAIGIGILIWRGRLWSGLKRSGRLLVTFGRNPGAASPKADSQGAAVAQADAQGGAVAVSPETFPYGIAIAAGTMWAWVQVYRLIF